MSTLSRVHSTHEIAVFAPTVSDAILLHDEPLPSQLRHAIADFVVDVREAARRDLIATATRPSSVRAAIIVGVAGQSDLFDELAAEIGLDLTPLRGKRETFKIVAVPPCLRYGDGAVVIAGSDANGAMYGVYEFSERLLGTDPMKFWTDFIPDRKDAYVWSDHDEMVGPPTFEYRGIFINDEDSLIGWRTDPRDRLIDETVYARILETTCRLKGNMIAPAMFAKYMSPEIRRLADERGLYYTASHLEILLSNPQNYWSEYCRQRWGTEFPYSYTLHPEKLREYWRDAIARHKAYRNIWPVGLKGITDFAFWFSDPKAPVTREERADLVNRALNDQLEMLREVGEVTATLTMREEVLDLYNTGRITVPSNVILVWDDWGHRAIMRQLPDEETQARAGGNGTYYHLAYCDNPWLQWVPLEVMRSEFQRIVAHGATRYVLFNVGNVREIPLTLSAAMDLAWDADRWLTADDQPEYFTRSWVETHFGAELADPIAELYTEYLNLEYACRATSVVEAIITHTTAMELKLLAPAPYDYIWNPVSSLDWVNESRVDELLRWYAKAMQLGPFHERLGANITREYLKRVLPAWERLHEKAMEAWANLRADRRPLFRDNLLLHLTSSRMVTGWANATLDGFEACRLGDFPAAARNFDAAAECMDAIFRARTETCQGKWADWYRGEYFNVWATCPWALKPDWHAKDSRALAAVARRLESGVPQIGGPRVLRPENERFIVTRTTPIACRVTIPSQVIQAAKEARLYFRCEGVPDDATVAVKVNGALLPQTNLHAKVYKEIVTENPPGGIVVQALDPATLKAGINTFDFSIRPGASAALEEYQVDGVLVALYPSSP